LNRKLKILWQIIIILFLTSIAFGVIKGGMTDSKKGKIQVTNILIHSDSEYLNNCYSISCAIKSFAEFHYIKMKTQYLDKNGKILSENNNAWEGNMIPNQCEKVYDLIGYKVGANMVLPSNIQILFFDDYNKHKNSEAIYITSIEIPNENNAYKGLNHVLVQE